MGRARECLNPSGEGIAAMAESGLSSGSETSAPNAGEKSGFLARIQKFWVWLELEFWAYDPEAPVFLRGLRSAAQLIALTLKGFQDDQLLLRASALTYVTALSIIPMLAVVIAVLGLVGGDQAIVNFTIEQLTTVAPEVQETVRGYAAGLDFAKFGTIGGAVVFGTAIFALRHLERTLNEIWGVARDRSWARRFSDYLAVMVVAPISIGVAVSLATTLQSEPMWHDSWSSRPSHASTDSVFRRSPCWSSSWASPSSTGSFRIRRFEFVLRPLAGSLQPYSSPPRGRSMLISRWARRPIKPFSERSPPSR